MLALLFFQIKSSNKHLSINNFNGKGLSILEISHRSKDFIDVLEEARSLAIEIAGLDKNVYSCLFLQGGASMKFLMTAYNFLNKNAAYINTEVGLQKP